MKLQLEGSNSKDHNYARQSDDHNMRNEGGARNNTVEIEVIDDENEITYENIKDVNALQKYLDTANEMKISDLEELNKNKIESLKGDIGLLWHYRLGHVSKMYLQKAKETIKELKGVKFNDSNLDCEICKRAEISKLPFNNVRFRYTEPLSTNDQIADLFTKALGRNKFEHFRGELVQNIKE